MLTTYSDLQTDVLRKLGVSTTTAYYSDAIVGSWIQQATRWATAYKKWPHTEGRVSTTFVAGTEEWAFEGYKAESFRMMQVGGKRLDKINFEDYQIFRETDPSGGDRVFANFGRLVYVNPQVDLSGTLTGWGQYTPVDIDITDSTAQTVFSGRDEEANAAIVDEVISYAMTREKKDTEAEYYHKRATRNLDELWKRVGDEKYAQKTHRTRGGMFKRIDVLSSDIEDDGLKRDQFLF